MSRACTNPRETRCYGNTQRSSKSGAQIKFYKKNSIELKTIIKRQLTESDKNGSIIRCRIIEFNGFKLDVFFNSGCFLNSAL